eukprot:Mrub_01848.p1 GENE.Mrub_01848~~Mrub_01848.p1  ORF type:complete len:615 (-),score=136.25 Mrub_01848:105-1838(-)
MQNYIKLFDKQINNNIDSDLNNNNMKTNMKSITKNDDEYNAKDDKNDNYDSIGSSKLNSNRISDSTNKSEDKFTVGIVLFKLHDLRIRDHEAILEANLNCQQVIYLFVMEDYYFKGLNSLKMPICGVHRRKFLLESLVNLNFNIRERSVDTNSLVVRCGDLSSIVTDVMNTYNAQVLYTHSDIDYWAVKTHTQMKTRVSSMGKRVFEFFNHTLIHVSDMKIDVLNFYPQCYKEYREKVTKQLNVRLILESLENMDKPAPAGLKVVTDDDIIDLWKRDVWQTEEFVDGLFVEREFNFDGGSFNFESGCPMVGGEDYGLQRVYEYITDEKKFGNFTNQKNYLLGVDGSTKIGAYLAFGNITAKQVYHIMQKLVDFNEQDIKFFIYKLIWRDFFKFFTMHVGVKAMDLYGIEGVKNPHSKSDISWKWDHHQIMNWIHGRTNYPIINAISREILNTGLNSHRARVITSCYLCKELQADWRIGQEWYENILVDYDYSLNFGNWMYYGNVGPTDFEGINKYFNLKFQKSYYDKKDIYTKFWLPDQWWLIQQDTYNIKMPWKEMSIIYASDINKDYENLTEQNN